MINCYKCYKCRKIENKLYCPFFGLNPCHRGEHCIEIPIEETVEDINEKRELPKRKIKIMYHKRTIGSLCYRERNFIFEQLQKGESEYKISRDLGIYPNQLDSFLSSVCRMNNLKKYDLANIEVVE